MSERVGAGERDKERGRGREGEEVARIREGEGGREEG